MLDVTHNENGSGRATKKEEEMTSKVECFYRYDAEIDSYVYYTNYSEHGFIVTKVFYGYRLICDNCDRLEVYNDRHRKYCSYCRSRGLAGKLHDNAVLMIDPSLKCALCGTHFEPHQLNIHQKDIDGERDKKEKN